MFGNRIRELYNEVKHMERFLEMKMREGDKIVEDLDKHYTRSGFDEGVEFLNKYNVVSREYTRKKNILKRFGYIQRNYRWD